MNPGKYNKSIEIWGPIKVVNDLKETTITNELLKTIWAEVVPQTGKLQSGQADTTFSKVDMKFKCRYSTMVLILGEELIAENYYIKFKGRRYDIKYILDPKFENRELEIFTSSIRE